MMVNYLILLLNIQYQKLIPNFQQSKYQLGIEGIVTSIQCRNSWVLYAYVVISGGWSAWVIQLVSEGYNRFKWEITIRIIVPTCQTFRNVWSIRLLLNNHCNDSMLSHTSKLVAYARRSKFTKFEELVNQNVLEPAFSMRLFSDASSDVRWYTIKWTLGDRWKKTGWYNISFPIFFSNIFVPSLTRKLHYLDNIRQSYFHSQKNWLRNTLRLNVAAMLNIVNIQGLYIGGSSSFFNKQVIVVIF